MILQILLYAFTGSITAAPFDFSKFVSLPAGTAFEIQSAGRRLGSGRIEKRTSSELTLAFNIESAGQSGQGRVELRFRDWNKKSVLLDLAYAGSWNGRAENTREQVSADRFLADNGILAFRFLSGSRFFQLAMSSRGETTVSTDWGTGRLVRRPE